MIRLKRTFAFLFILVLAIGSALWMASEPGEAAEPDPGTKTEIAGIYEGTSGTESGLTTYSHTLTLNTDGTYTCLTTYTLELEGTVYNNSETESGNYDVTEDTISFHGDKLVQDPDMMGNSPYPAVESSGVIQGNSIKVSRFASYMAQTMKKDKTEIVFEQKESFSNQDGEVFEDLLVSGKYQLKEDSYDDAAAMKVPALITINTSEKTFFTQDLREGKDLAAKGSGNYIFDETTGIYTVTYTADTRPGVTAQFTYSDKGITFVTPMYFGMASMNVTDEDGNFIPYTAVPYQGKEDESTKASESDPETKEPEETDPATKPTKEPETGDSSKDQLSDGTYYARITKEAMGSEITYDIKLTVKKGRYTYKVTTSLPAKDYKETETVKGTVSTKKKKITFKQDDTEKIRIKTGTVVDDETVKVKGFISGFAFSEEEITLSKEKPEETTTEQGGKEEKTTEPEQEKTTAPTPDDPEKPDTVLRSGTYALRDEDYDDSAYMKMPVDIKINAKKGTFSIRNKNGEAKGSGTISLNEKTGVYTMTYTSGGPEKREDPTCTFTYKNRSITFTSPILIGSASMTIVDKDGNFIPYTAHLLGEDDPEEKTTAGKPEYQFVEGANGTIAQGNSASYTLRVRDKNGSGEFEKFVSLEMDGSTVDPDNYEKSEGSVILKIKGSFLQQLKEGSHVIKVNFTDGSVETRLTVRSASARTTGNNTTTRRTSPRTADDSNAVMYLILCLAAIAVLTSAMVYRKRQSR